MKKGRGSWEKSGPPAANIEIDRRVLGNTCALSRVDKLSKSTFFTATVPIALKSAVQCETWH